VIKGIELLKEVVPGLSRLAFLRNATSRVSATGFERAQGAAVALVVQVLDLDVHSVAEMEPAFGRAVEWGADRLFLNPDPALIGSGVTRRVADLAAKSQLPAMYSDGTTVAEFGGLMSNAPSLSAIYRRAADYVDKILNGAQPGDLPVEQPREFEFVVNVNAAQVLGISFPPDVAVQVTEWIQ
jgi:putative tryptophan/tyrosine transport system substrate-binding protein